MNINILEVHADGELITHVRYHAEKNGVETEGYCHFIEPSVKVPFANIQESDVLGWIRAQIGAELEKRLDDQGAVKQTKTVAPWLPQIFTPGATNVDSH